MKTVAPGTRRALQVLSVVLLVAGFGLVIAGFAAFLGSMSDFSQPPVASFAMFAGGGFLAAIGSMLARFAFLKPVSEYVAGETSDAVEHAAGAVGRGLSGAVVKVRCRSCGFLDSEDARFCSGCGQGM